MEFQPLFRSEQRLTAEQLRPVEDAVEANAVRFPAGWPLLIFGGEWDYSRPFLYPGYPAELIADWNRLVPSRPLRIATLGDYLDAIQPRLRNEKLDLPVAMSSQKYGWPAFWVNVPKVKQRYRRAEHQLQAAEALATIASVTTKLPYPAQELANSWFLMALNMDRNILWGAGVDESFRDAQSWDTEDRFNYVEGRAAEALHAAAAALGGSESNGLTLFNPLSWERRDPWELRLPDGKSPIGLATQTLSDGQTLAAGPNLQAMEVRAAKLAAASPSAVVPTRLPSSIANPHYEARIDPVTGALTSLKLKPSGREVLGGPANRLVAEAKSDVHNLPEKPLRTPLAESGQYPAVFSVVEGPIATVVEIRSPFLGGSKLRRTMRFYRDSARIDFDTEVEDLPAGVVLSVEFPLAEPVLEVRRGIPYGFSHARSRGNTRLAGHRCRNHSCDPVLTLYDRRRWRRGHSGSRHSGPGADRQDGHSAVAQHV